MHSVTQITWKFINMYVYTHIVHVLSEWWWSRAMKTDEQDAGWHALEEMICCHPSSHLPTFFTLGFFHSFPSLPLTYFFSPCWAHISLLQDFLEPCLPHAFIWSSNMGTSSRCHPVCHLQKNKNTKQKPASFICPQTKSPSITSLPSLSLALSLLSSFSLTISCGGLRTHQLSQV